jgi:hypothetical protein
MAYSSSSPIDTTEHILELFDAKLALLVSWIHSLAIKATLADTEASIHLVEKRQFRDANFPMDEQGRTYHLATKVRIFLRICLPSNSTFSHRHTAMEPGLTVCPFFSVATHTVIKPRQMFHPTVTCPCLTRVGLHAL